MNCSIIFIGESKADGFSELFAEYQKMLGNTALLEEIRIKPSRSSNDMSDAEIKKCLESEGDAILSMLGESKFSKCMKIAMCIEGKLISSEEFAEIINSSAVSGKSGFVFIIGGSWGLSERVKNACDMKLSFSKMTFPHKLFKVMLAEQIYRAFSILQGKKYHK